MKTTLTGLSVRTLSLHWGPTPQERKFSMHGAWDHKESPGRCECKPSRGGRGDWARCLLPQPPIKPGAGTQGGPRDPDPPWTGAAESFPPLRAHPSPQIVGVWVFSFCHWVWERKEHQNRGLVAMASRGPLSCQEAGDETATCANSCNL